MDRMQRVFITVKTYPTLSKKYDELVCTAGILNNAGWVRIYPLPFRRLNYADRYKKYQWIEAPLIKNEGDPRPESYKIMDIDKVKPVGKPIGTERGWSERKNIIFGNCNVYYDLSDLIKKAHSNELSLAVFKPTKILGLAIENTEREWNQEKLKQLKEKAKQLSLFQTEEELKKQFSIVNKLPYKFSYKLKDCNGKESTMMIEDWEIGMLYWNCLRQTKDDEDKTLTLVRKKYIDEFSNKDIFLFLGTTRAFHARRPRNPFVIIGVFYPPPDKQASFL